MDTAPVLDSPRVGLEEAILANPSDLQLRLVYSDCLEEEGEGERAEVVRERVAHSLRDYHTPCFCKGRGFLILRGYNQEGHQYESYQEVCPVCNGAGKPTRQRSREWLLGLGELPETVARYREEQEDLSRRCWRLTRGGREIVDEEGKEQNHELRQLALSPYTRGYYRGGRFFPVG